MGGTITGWESGGGQGVGAQGEGLTVLLLCCIIFMINKI